MPNVAPAPDATRVELRDRFQRLDTAQFVQAENTEEACKKKRNRGLEFERLLYDLFTACNIPAAPPYHTAQERDEQIDGAIEVSGRHALLEAKWVESGLAASDLYAFLGKVEGKFEGTIGIFISREELHDNFLSALRHGRRQKIVVIHGADVDAMFEPGFNVEEYIKAQIRYLSRQNKCHYAAADFLAEKQAEQQIEAPSPPDQDVDITAVFRECITETFARNLVNERARHFTPEQRELAAIRLLNNYETIVGVLTSATESWKGENLLLLLEELVAILPQHQTPVDTKFFMEVLSPQYGNPLLKHFWSFFAPRFRFLTAAEKRLAEERLGHQWRTVFNNYNSENVMANVTQTLWPYLSPEGKASLMPLFVEIILSMRYPGYPQHRLAFQAIREAQQDNVMQEAARTAFRDMIRSSAESWVSAGWGDAEDKGKIITAIAESNRAMRPFISDFDQTITDIVTGAQADHNAAGH